MNSAKTLFFSGLIGLVSLSSCTMEKRIYSRGFHIECNIGNKGKKEDGTITYQQAKKAVKKEHQKSGYTAIPNTNGIDSSFPPPDFKPSKVLLISEKTKDINPAFTNNKKNKVSKRQDIFSDQAFKKQSGNYAIDVPFQPSEIDDPSTAGFVLGLTCMLLTFVFGALFIPFIFAIVGVVTSMIGLIEDAGDQYVTGIILAMCGLAMCGFVLIFLAPIIGPIAAALFFFFLANPGVFVTLLLLFGLYLLLSGF